MSWADWTDSGQRGALVETEIDTLTGQKPRPASEPWEGFAGKYVEACKSDFRHLMAKLSKEMQESLDYPRAESPEFDLESSDSFGAHIEILPNSSVRCQLSLGLFWGLEDYTSTIVCDEHAFRSLAPLTAGKKFAFAAPLDCLVRPEVRFCKYTPFMHYYGRTANQLDYDTQLTAYVRNFPLDPGRAALAQIILRIQILWVMLHESAHYAEGHLKYYQDSFDLADRGCRLNEIGGQAGPPGKAFEFLADRFATLAVLRIMTSPSVRFQLAPQYHHPTVLLQVISIAIGCVVLVFDKARRVFGGADSHPSARTRLATAFNEINGALDLVQWNGMRATDETLNDVVMYTLADLSMMTLSPRLWDGSFLLVDLGRAPNSTERRVREVRNIPFATAEDRFAAAVACSSDAWNRARMLDRAELHALLATLSEADPDLNLDLNVSVEQYIQWAKEYAELYIDQARALRLVARYRLDWRL